MATVFEQAIEILRNIPGGEMYSDYLARTIYLRRTRWSLMTEAFAQRELASSCLSRRVDRRGLNIYSL